MKKYTLESYTKEMYDKDIELVNSVDNKLGRNWFSNPTTDNEIKERILQETLGYKGLRIGGNKSEQAFIPLSQANPGRVHSVLKERYSSAHNRIEEFGNPSKRKSKKTLVGKMGRNGQFSFVFR